MGEEEALAAKVTQSMINQDPNFKVHVNLTIADTGLDININPGDPGSTLDQSLNYLINEEEVHAIVGALRSSRSIPIAQRCAREQIVQVSHAYTSIHLFLHFLDLLGQLRRLYQIVRNFLVNLSISILNNTVCEQTND